MAALSLPLTPRTPSHPLRVYFESEQHCRRSDPKDTAEVYPDLIVQTLKRHMSDANWLRSFHEGLSPRCVRSDLRKVLRCRAGAWSNDRRCLITCPAYFGNVEKEATRQPDDCGLNVRFVVPEPMAAAFAYGWMPWRPDDYGLRSREVR